MAKILNKNDKGMQTATCETCNSEIGYWFHELRLEFKYLKFRKVKEVYMLGLSCPHCNDFIGLISIGVDELDELVSKSRTGVTKESFLIEVLKDRVEITNIRDKFVEDELHEYGQLIDKSDLILLKVESLCGEDKYIVVKDRYRDVSNLFFSERNYSDYVGEHDYKHIQIIAKYKGDE